MSARHTRENFPVASWLLSARLRGPVRVFYAFARKADDVADAPDLFPDQKLARLGAMRAEATSLGAGAPYARELLTAFERDAVTPTTADWDGLMAYCRLSAAPVGRYLIDLVQCSGGEAAYRASDALCAALQVLNHVQDCGDDFRALGRAYLPADWLAHAGVSVTDLGGPACTPALRRVLDRVLDGVDGLLAEAGNVGTVIADKRLAREAAGIHALAVRLAQALRRHDPLAERVRLAKPIAAWTFFKGAFLGGGPRPRASSFAEAMRLLPPRRRDALFALYACCRAADDIADGLDAPEEKMAQLAEWRADVRRLFAGQACTVPAIAALKGAVADFQLAESDLLALLDGMETDAAGPVRMPDTAALALYCDRVAGTVGRLASAIFGAEATAARPVAEHLGAALQLTNILRDVAEDAARDRVYLPADLLARHGVPNGDAEAVLLHPRLGGVLDSLARQADDHYAAAAAALPACGPRMRPARVMAAVYARLLDRLRARGWARPGAPVRVPRAEKIWLLLRHGGGG